VSTTLPAVAPARSGRATARPPGPRGAEAARTLARMVTGRPLEACAALFARYGDTVYLPVRPREGLYILSQPEQAEHVLAANQDNYVKPFTYRPLRVLLGDGLLTAGETTWRRHRGRRGQRDEHPRAGRGRPVPVRGATCWGS